VEEKQRPQLLSSLVDDIMIRGASLAFCLAGPSGLESPAGSSRGDTSLVIMISNTVNTVNSLLAKRLRLALNNASQKF
jgi:hypothetical protein